ncbi:hypothetical protein B296_00025019 [Ensete ventricosum]|uniref:Uncharacterized protein n=1 Tax=Ensete ventricosum TaxID=4639 RepID=A0A426ZKJ1_ENSVE|nr:hypothetical protein B296_00025019 [Ensete ventricosum]
MAPHLAGAPLRWAVWGARDSEETEKETSGVLKEPEIGTALGARPTAKESIGRVLSWLGSTHVHRSIYVGSTFKPRSSVNSGKASLLV